jgi:thiol-disulfide isomerase/thioredoxin
MSVDTALTTFDEALKTPLLGVDGAHHSLSSLRGEKGTVVVFVGNGCPTVRSYEDRLMRLQERYRPRGINVIAINSNNPFLSPPDTVAELRKRARLRGFNFPYLKDAEGVVARSFGAVCTPHAFLLDDEDNIAYRGRIDDSRVGDAITSHDLANAIDDLLGDRPVTVPIAEPFGCSIVW